MSRHRFGVDAVQCFDLAPAKGGVVGREQLDPAAGLGHAHAVLFAGRRGQVHDHDDLLVAAATEERQHAVVVVTAVDPLEAVGAGIVFPERRRCEVEATQRLHEGLQLAPLGVLEQVPVHAAFVVPLALLPDLGAHEHQLLAGPRVLVGQQQAEVRELLPVVARHLRIERAFAVHDLVVADAVDEVLVELVDHREGQLVLVVAAVDRILLEILESVVHPPHVPLEGEAEASFARVASDAGPGGAFFGDGEGAGHFFFDDVVGRLDELDGVHVLPPAVLVRQPLIVRPAVVQVEHRRDGIDA